MDYNIIAIGGTGMRCAECVVHLCAMGMFDDTVVNLLALDTDLENGNFARLRDLVKNYNSITGDRGVDSNTLFSAKINFFEFSPDYNKKNFNEIAHFGDADTTENDVEGVKWKESDLANLFLTPEMRDMDLTHGYRAQTQMGSMLMYHAIREHAYKNKDKNTGLVRFIRNLMDNNNSIVFMFGSVFGGTGASSIPILPHALQEAAKIISRDGQGDVLQNNLFGTVMLTNYFSFLQPKEQKTNEVIATSDKFALNSQAALSFYVEDKTVQDTYKRLYLIGREEMRDVSVKNTESVTGGFQQRNPEDYMELAAASAAYDFFKAAKKHIGGTNSKVFDDHAQTFYRTISSDDRDCLDFGSFFGEDNEKFAQRCGIMMVSAYLFGPQRFAEERKEKTFKTLTEDNVKDIKKFFRRFYNLEGVDKENPDKGWIMEMQESAIDDHYKGFLFNDAAFNAPRPERFNYNDKLYPNGSRHKYHVSMISNAFSVFRDEFGNYEVTETDNTVVAKLLKRTFETFTKLYGFNS